MEEYTKHIPYDVATLLKEKHCRLSWTKYKTDGHPNCTTDYAHIFDWLKSKGIVITLEPFFTFSLVGNIAYTWFITVVHKDDGTCEKITEQDLWTPDKSYGGSFVLTANEAIKEALKYI